MNEETIEVSVAMITIKCLDCNLELTPAVLGITDEMEPQLFIGGECPECEETINQTRSILELCQGAADLHGSAATVQ